MSEYLAIKSWAKFQSLRGKGRYIFDYTQQDDEPALAKLSFFQRGVYQEIRRYRGRSGKNMLNDHEFIASSTFARLKDRPRLPQAIRELIACGLLVLTNQEVDVLKTGEKEKDIEKEKDKKQTPAVAESVSEKPKRASKPRPEPSQIFDKAYESYPKHEAKRDAERAWGKAVNSEVAKRVAPLAEHEDFLYQRVMHYGAVMRKKLALHQIERRFIPLMATWLNKGRYLDDPSEWEARQEQTNGIQDPRNAVETAIAKSAADREITKAAVAAGVAKFLRGKDAVGGGDVPRAFAAKSGNTS